MAGDHTSKVAWEAQNVIVARAKINRNQDPELYKFLSEATNQAQAVRTLLRAGLTTLQQENNSAEASYPQPKWVADWDYPSSNYNK